MTSDLGDRARPLGPDERTGVLAPGNLQRYGARWFDPAAAVTSVVDRYWFVEWNLDAGERIEQRIIDTPSVTLTLETGDGPGPLVVTGVQERAWTRIIAGSGSAFGIRLRPAGLAALSSLSPTDIADSTVPLTPALSPGLHALLAEVSEAPTPAERAAAADAAITQRLAAAPLTPDLLLANAIVEELTLRVRSPAGQDLAEQFGVSERTVQRVLKATLGKGPKWISRRVRLQEVARVLATEPDADLAALAADLGYTDQAHLTGDFRAVTGITPGAYRRSLQALAPR
ncbi:MAG TPA: helix-turn-helix domain-containing protein [Naasia sp.]